MREIDDAERRARLARRHAVAPQHRVGDPVAATEAVVVLHSTEPATVHLSLHARVEGLTRVDTDRALYAERSLVKQLAMRRTLFVFPRDLLPAVWGSAAARTAGTERARLGKDLRTTGVSDDPDTWLPTTDEQGLAALAAAPDGLTATELRAAAPRVDVRLDGGTAPLNPGRFLSVLGAEARVVRGDNTSHWRVFRPRWRTTGSWLGAVPEALPAREGYAALVGRWLARFGPGTETDLVWWLGATKGIVRAALADLGAVEVLLADGQVGHVLPDDVEPEPPVEPWAALLPVLDPTVMGWKERAFYLGGHGPALFDRNGNAGTTAWWDGRVVGCWTQDPDGVVEVRPLEALGADAVGALRTEAARLTEWLDGERVGTVYPSPTMRQDPGEGPYPVLRA